jgi:hypothetical protein
VGSTLQDLIGEQPAFARKLARHLELAANIAADFGDRVAVGIELAERIEPGVEHAVDQCAVHRLLGAEIVEQVRLRHASHLRDLVDGRAAKTIR